MIIIKMAAFRAPNKGDRIEIPKRGPGQYFLVTDKPQVGTDPRGQAFWTANALDPQGNPLPVPLRSDQVDQWQHFKGQNYPWHDEMLQRKKMEQKRQEQEQQVGQFEQKYKFPDGQVMRERMPPMVVRVNQDAIGDLEVFKGENVAIKAIDYATGMVQVEPVGEGLAGLETAVPADQLMRSASPTLPAGAAKREVNLQNGTKVDMDHLVGMTKAFNAAVVGGNVTAAVQVYQAYSTRTVESGEEKYLQEMAELGVTPSEGSYKVNTAGVEEGQRRRGGWQATLKIPANVVSDELRNEIRMVAPASQIFETGNGIIVHSNELYKIMVALRA